MADLSKMSRFLQPPKVKLSDYQWRTLLKRHMDQQSIDTLREGRIPQGLQEDILRYEAPAEAEVGRLVQAGPMSRRPEEEAAMRAQGVVPGIVGPDIDKVIETMPIAQARQKWQESAGAMAAGERPGYVGYTAGKIPPTQELSLGPSGGPFDITKFMREAQQPSSQLPEYVLPGIDYKNLRLGKVDPNEVAAKAGAKGLLEARGIAPDAIKAKAVQPGEKEVGTAVKLGGIASEIWKDIGDFRTTSGKDWRRLWEQTPGGKMNYGSAKEFFISQFMKYQDNPKSIKNPYMKRLLDGYWRTWQETTKGGLK